MKIGAVCSAGGSAFFSAVDILLSDGRFSSKDFFVVTDRPCGAEQKCCARGIPHERITASNKIAFSSEAAKAFTKAKSTILLLFFTRLVSEDLFEKFVTLNVHPSFLPAFRGFGAIKQAQKAGVRFLGATLHIASAKSDAGEIISQVVTPITSDMDEFAVSKISFLQKTYLALCAIDLFEQGIYAVQQEEKRVLWNKPARTTWSANPALYSEAYIGAFHKFQKSFEIEALVP